MRTMRINNKRTQAFTLIELSIVLVILGLLAGGILVGRDLINAASIRAQISQIQRFDSAVSVFKLKFAALPGDIISANAIVFGITTQHWLGSCACQTGGNENGIIEDGGYPITAILNEAYLFFVHLAKANLISDIAGNVDYPYGTRGCSYSNSNYNQYVGCQYPAAKIGKGGFTATSLPNGNLAYFLGMTATDINAAFNNYSIGSSSDGLGVVTPSVANALDKKLDDGIPLSGKIQASRYPATPEARNNYCLTSVAANAYNLTNPASTCNLLIESAAR